MTKKCIDCQEEKDCSLFYKEKRNKDGIMGNCFDCFKQRRKKYEHQKRVVMSSLYLDKDFMDIIKTCIECGNSKSRKHFYKSSQHKDGHSPYCKICAKGKERENRFLDIEDWRKTHNKQQTVWRENNKDKVALSKKKWKRSRRKRDPIFRLQESLRSRIRLLVSGKGKSANTMKLLGCDMTTYRTYIQSQFTDGMSWDNYGEWHIDHIKPCCSFDLTISENQFICFNYTNTQPLWKADNLSKVKEDKKMSAKSLILRAL